MFDGLKGRKALEAEVAEIEAKLEPLTAEREDLRLQRGRLITASFALHDSGVEREARDLGLQVDRLDTEIGALRTRRRELHQMLRVATPVAEAIVNVPMPPALVRAQEALDRARAERQEMVLQLQRADEGEARALGKRIETAEARIAALRVERAKLLPRYNAEVIGALRPIVAAAASDMAAACDAFVTALRTLQEAAQSAPAPVDAPHLGNPLGIVSTLSSGHVQTAQRIAQDLAATWGEPALEAAAE